MTNGYNIPSGYHILPIEVGSEQLCDENTPA